MNRPITFVIGAAVGASVGYFVSSVVADYIDEKELRDLAPVVITDEDDEEPSNDDDEESSQGNIAMKKKRDKKPKREQLINYTSYFNALDRPDLAALARKYNEGIVDDPTVGTDLINDEFLETKVLETTRSITIISQEEFNNNPDGYEIVELSYYADEIIVGEDDNIIPGPEDIIGEDALVSFGLMSGDPDIVYVRNTNTRALYEIVRMSAKYAIDSEAEVIKPRKGLKKGIDFDEVNDDENDEEADS